MNWVLDADIRSFFDSVDHEWHLRMLAHRIADPRILKLVELEAAGRCPRERRVEGNRQGDEARGRASARSSPTSSCTTSSIPDPGRLRVQQWRRRRVPGRVVIVRYADDFVIGFQREADARAMLSELGERLAVFGQALHEHKTRLIEFGRFAATSRRQRGERRPETFAFLGFTHYCGWTRDGRFIVKHKTESKRLTLELKAPCRGGVAADARHRWPPSIAGMQPCWSAIMATTDAPTTTARSPASAAKFGASGSPASGGEARRAGRCGGTSSMR